MRSSDCANAEYSLRRRGIDHAEARSLCLPLGGVHRGREGITAFLGESAQLTSGTLHAVPEAIMADGDGRVAVLVRISGERPDGRRFDVPQILLCGVDGDRVRTIDQFVGDPAAVTAFWA